MKKLLLALWLTLAAPILVGCDQGPAEEAGEEIDDAVDEIDDEI